MVIMEGTRQAGRSSRSAHRKLILIARGHLRFLLLQLPSSLVVLWLTTPLGLLLSLLALWQTIIGEDWRKAPPAMIYYTYVVLHSKIVCTLA